MSRGHFFVELSKKERKYTCRVPQGWESLFLPDVALLLEMTIYGLKQAAMAFWVKLLAAMKKMKIERSTVDPCLYYKWTDSGPCFIVSWIDDNLICGNQVTVTCIKKQLMALFDCEDCGPMVEYVGNTITRQDDGLLKFLQKVLVKKLEDEFDIKSTKKVKIPAKQGTLCTKFEDDVKLSPPKQTTSRSGVGILLHMMQWSRPEICHAVRDEAQHMNDGRECADVAMRQTMSYIVTIPNRGHVLSPKDKGTWNGKSRLSLKMVIKGRSDSDHGKDPQTRRSVSSTRVSVNDSVNQWRSATQKHVTLSVT